MLVLIIANVILVNIKKKSMADQPLYTGHCAWFSHWDSFVIFNSDLSWWQFFIVYLDAVSKVWNVSHIFSSELLGDSVFKLLRNPISWLCINKYWQILSLLELLLIVTELTAIFTKWKKFIIDRILQLFGTSVAVWVYIFYWQIVMIRMVWQVQGTI